MGQEFETDEELDAYAEGQDNGNSGPTKGDVQAPAVDKSAPVEYEYMARGKTIKEPLDQILKRASQGYDYAQLLNDFNKKQMDFDSRSKEFDSRYGHYTNIDKWAQQNPQQWQYIQSQYQSQFQQQQGNRPQVDQFGQTVPSQGGQSAPDPRYQQLESKLSEHDKFISERQAQESADKMAKEDETLKKDVESIRKEYSYLDFDTPDESGKSLYFKVLEHARDIGVTNFRVAFRDFNHDKLLKLAEERGKEKIASDTVKKTKLGLVSGKQTPPPQRDFTPKEIRSMSYDDVDREGRKSIGLT